jgi:ferredoxin
VKYTVDQALCSGHGQCAALAGHVYDLDDDGFNVDAGKTVEVAPELADAAELGAEGCPEQAIRVISD